MTVKTVVPYKRTPRPNDPASLPQYTDNEYRKLEATLKSLQDAVQQIQQASSLPIT